MFDIGFLELVVILVLALLVLGPERLPKAARTVGYWFGKARRYVEGMKSQVEAEFDTTEVKRLLHNQEVQIRELQSKLHETDNDISAGHINQFDTAMQNSLDSAEDDEAFVKEIAEKSLEEKRAGPQYEMIEESDERWDELEENNSSEKVLDEPIAEDKPAEIISVEKS